MREKRRLRLFENSVDEDIWPERDEVPKEWRNLHNEELNYVYSSPNIFRVIQSRRARLGGRPEGKRPLGRPRRR